MGVVCVHGMALGVLVVPEEKRIVAASSGLQDTESNSVVSTKKSCQYKSVSRRDIIVSTT